MLNSLHELTFSTTADSVEAGYIREDYYAVVQVEGQYREFIIDSIVESDDSDLIKEVKASLSSIELNDTLLENKVTGSDPRLLLTSILSATRWSVGIVETGIYNRNFPEDVQFMTALEAIHTLAEFYNCDIHFSYVIDGNKVVKRSVNLFVRLGSADGKRFEIDKDITSIEREIDTTALKTAIYPVMKTEDDDGKTVLTTIANVAWSKAAGDPVDKPLGQKYVGDPVALQNWGRLDKDGNLRHRMKLYEFTEEVTVAQMLSMSWVNLAKYTSPKVTYTVNVVDLYSLLGEDYLHEKVVIGDTVTIIDRYFAVPIEISDRVIEIERDLLDPSNTVVTVGSESKSYNSDRGGRDQVLNDKIDAVNKNAVSALESANGKNTIYYGSLEPAKPNTGDTWFRPHPDNPEEQQMLVWDGVQWIVELDTSKTTEIQDAIAAIDKDLEDNIKTANEAVNKAQQAIDSAGFANSSITAANGQIASLEQNLNGFQQVVQDTYANKNTVTSLATQWTQTTALANGHTSQINSLGEQLNLRVTKGELISQINISPETILIASSKIQIKGDTYIESGVIKTAHIADLAVSGAKIANASIASAKIISLDAAKITAGTVNGLVISSTSATGQFSVQGQNAVFLNTSTGRRAEINETGMDIYNADGRLRAEFNQRAVNTGLVGTNTYNVYLGTGGTDGEYGEAQGGEVRVVRYDSTVGGTGVVTDYTYRPIRAEGFVGNYVNANTAFGTVSHLYLRPRYSTGEVRVTGSGSITAYQPLRASGIFANTLDDNSLIGGTHIYVRPAVGGQLRVTRPGTTDQFQDIRASVFYGSALDSTATNMYVRGASGGEVRATVTGTTDSYIPVRASAYPTGSMEAFKTNIHKRHSSALELIRQSDIYEYNLKSELRTGKVKTRIGLVIGSGYNTPAEIIDGDGVEQYAMNSLAWQAIQELDTSLTTVTQQLNSVANSRLQQTVEQLQQEMEQKKTALGCP